MRLWIAALLVLSTGLLACQSSDVGAPCRIVPVSAQTPSNPIDDQPVPADFVASNPAACDELICIKSPQRDSAYCSRPCVSNSDCSQGLVCRELTFNDNFLKTLPPDVQATYTAGLGSIGVSNYCATPLQ